MTTMTETALLRAVLEEPGEDLHRLAYADWLEDRDAPGDDERAEFVRVQLRLAAPAMAVCACFESRWPGRTYVCEGCTLRRRERELLRAENALAWGPDRPAWAAGLTLPFCTTNWGQDCLPGYVGVRFARGFVGEVALPCVDFLADGVAAALFGAAPVTAVTLTDRSPQEYGAGGSWWYREWEGGQAGRLRHFLPADLFDRLPRADPGVHAHWHPGEAAARAALSSACIAHGREAAGLPPLPPR